MMSVIERIAHAWDQISATTIRNSWNKIVPNPDAHAVLPPTPTEENADFVTDFTDLNIVVREQDVSNWFTADGPGYEHLNEDGIVKLVNGADDDG